MKGLFIVTKQGQPGDIIRVRFRLRDGRGVNLYHSSNLRATLSELGKFSPDGEPRPRVTIYNRELRTALSREISAIEQAYAALCAVKPKETIRHAEFEATIANVLRWGAAVVSSNAAPLLPRFEKYMADCYRDKVFGEGRWKHYKTFAGDLRHYLLVRKREDYPCGYTDIGLRERFILASAAFGQPLYKADNNLAVIPASVADD